MRNLSNANSCGFVRGPSWKPRPHPMCLLSWWMNQVAGGLIGAELFLQWKCQLGQIWWNMMKPWILKNFVIFEILGFAWKSGSPLENKHSFHNDITSIELKKRNPCPLVWMRAPARIVFLESLQLHLSCSQLQPPGRMDTANLSTRSWPYSWWIRDDFWSLHFQKHTLKSTKSLDEIWYDRIW